MLRFQFVSKSWFSMINNKSFFKSLLDKESTYLNLILDSRHDNQTFSAGLHTSNEAKQISGPFDVFGYASSFIGGSCNGLLCVRQDPWKSCQDFQISMISLWNPSTELFHTLPSIPTKGLPVGSNLINCAIGYDSLKDDFKVLALLWPTKRINKNYRKGGKTSSRRPSNDSFYPEVWIQELQGGEWKPVDAPAHCSQIYQKRSAVVSNGWHWLINDRIRGKYVDSIVALDMFSEKFGTFAVPEELTSVSLEGDKELGVLGDRLCISSICISTKNCVEIWVMNEYGMEDSWMKLFSVAQTVLRTEGVERLVPLACSKNTHDVLFELNRNKFFWYYPQTERAEDIEIIGLPDQAHHGYTSFVCHQTNAPVTGKFNAISVLGDNQ